MDVARLRQLSGEFAEQMATIETEIYRAGRPDVQHQLAAAAPPGALRRAEAAVALEDARRRAEHGPGRPRGAAPKHPLPALLLRHRQLGKLKGTYLDALPELVHPERRPDPRLVQPGGRRDRPAQLERPEPPEHPGAHRGRPADPPGVRRGPARLAAADGRLLADRAADPRPLLGRPGACAGPSPRTTTSTARSRRGSSAWTSRRWTNRSAGWPRRSISASIYGLSPFGLAARLGITQAEAAAFIDAYFKEYAGVDRFITRSLEEAHGRAAGSRRSWAAAGRSVGIKSTTGRVRNLAERTAVNTIIQGSAADLIKRAMIRIDQELRDRGFAARMLLQIHDELVFEAPAEEIPRPRRAGPPRDDRRARPERPAEGRHGRRAQLAGRRFNSRGEPISIIEC